MNINAKIEKRPRPLEGVRVVECGIWHAGPGGTAILADLGAEVIKVESLEGDPERTHSGLGTVSFKGCDKEDWSLLYEVSNRNKKGICLDIASEKGKEVLARLVKTADVFLTSMRKTTIPKLGIDYESLKKINPKLVYISVSGFGSKGPMADVGGFDPMGQAISGMAIVSGQDRPIVLQLLIVDQLTAITVSHAIITALFVRERHGYGQELHVSLYGSSTWLLHFNLLTASVMKTHLKLDWDRTTNPPLRNSYKCKDGKWLMATNHPEYKYLPIACQVLGLDNLMNDPRFATPEARAENARDLIAILDEMMLQKDRDEWLALLQRAGLNFVPVQEFDEVLKDPQALVNDYVVHVDHPVLGKIAMPGFPIQFSANETCSGPAPERGQHTDVVLGELGYGAAEIASFKQMGIAK